MEIMPFGCVIISSCLKASKRYIRQQNDIEHSSKETSSGLPSKNFTNKSHGYLETSSTSDHNFDIVSNSSSPDDDDGILEVCNLSHNDISNATLFSWVANFGASLHILDEASIFK
jgi:hypothetical protein